MLNILLCTLAGAFIGLAFAWHKTRGMVATIKRVKAEPEEFANAGDEEKARAYRLGAAYTMGSIKGARLGALLIFAGIGALAGALFGLVLYLLGGLAAPPVDAATRSEIISRAAYAASAAFIWPDRSQ